MPLEWARRLRECEAEKAALRKRIAQLEAGEEVAAKDIKAVLTQPQWQAIEDAWKYQQQLREQEQARSEQEQKALGWKTKREIRLEVLREALEVAKAGVAQAWRQKQDNAAVRQMKTYFKAFAKARALGKDVQMARNEANNALTRKGLRRFDGAVVRSQSQRDKEVRELEARIREMGSAKDDAGED